MTSKVKLYSTLLVPSGMSLTLSIFVSCLTLLFYRLSLFLNYFNVKGSLRVGNYILNHINSLLSFLIGSQNLDSTVLFLFWGSVGLVVFVMGQTVIRDITEVSSDIHAEKRFLWPRNSRPHLITKFIERIVFRVAVAILLIIYCGHVLSFFLRGKVTTVDIFGQSLSSFLVRHSVLNQVSFVVLEVIALQGAVILLRLLFMRSRVFRS